MLTAPPTYSLTERDRRWAIAREVMRTEGLDALLVYGEHDCVPIAPFAPDVYFTNDRPGTIVVFVGDADPVQLVWSPMHLGDHIEAVKRGDAVWFAPWNIRVGKDAAHVAEVLFEHGVQNGRIGIAGMEPYPPWHVLPIFPHALHEGLGQRCPDAELAPVWFPLLHRMLPNSAEELALVEHAAGIGDAISEAMLGATHPGATDNDVLTAGMAEAFGLGAQPQILLSSGPGFVSWGPTPWSYRPQAPRRIEDGDVVMAEVLNSVALKESQSQVAIAVGEVHPDIEEATRVARACYDAGLAVLRPGRTFGDVVEAMLEPMTRAGGWNVHPMIHSINPYGPVCGFGAGMSRFGPAQDFGGRGEVPTIASGLVLQPGMTFSFEPNCVLGGRLSNIGGTVVVGAEGPIELNTFTATLLRA